MKLSKILFIFSLIGILFLLILVKTSSKTYEGKIQSIDYSNGKISINIENFDKEVIIFGSELFNLKKGDIISFKGKKGVYQGNSQILVDKIWKIN